MIEVLFDLKSNIYALSPLFTILTNLVLLLVVYKKLNHTYAYKIFSYLLGVNMVNATAELLARMSTSQLGASYWWWLESVSQHFIPVMILGFALYVTYEDNAFSTWYRRLLLFFPLLVFIILSTGTNLIIDHRLENYTYTNYSWTRPYGPLFFISILWLVLSIFLAMGMLIRHYRHIEDTRKKVQIKVFITALVLPTVFYTVFYTVSAFVEVPVIPRSTLFNLLFNIPFISTVVYGILKYDLFSFNPATAFDNIIASMNEMLIVTNEHFFIEFINPMVSEITGYTEKDLIGIHLKDIFESDWTSFEETIYVQYTQGQNYVRAEHTLRKRNGALVPVALSVTIFKDNEARVKGYIGVLTDISKLKELYDVTAERNKLSAVLSSISDGVVALDELNRIQMINSSFCRRMGVKEADVIHKPFSAVFTTVYNGSIVQFEDIYLANEESKVDTPLQDVVLLMTDKESILSKLTYSIIPASQVADLKGIITIQDLTEKMELEKMKLDFVFMTAHELRTPLTSLKGYIELIQKEVAAYDNKELQNFASRTQIAIDDLGKLIEDVLTVANADRKQLPLHVKDCNIGELVMEKTHYYKALAEEKGLTFKMDSNYSEHPLVKADKHMIDKVLKVLLDNAVTYTEHGTITVTEEIDTEHNLFIMHITDTGRGIPKKSMPHIFKKFYHVATVMEDSQEGVGIGLYLAKAIVDQHGGRMWVESELHQGSTFSFSLPLADNDLG